MKAKGAKTGMRKGLDTLSKGTKKIIQIFVLLTCAYFLLVVFSAKLNLGRFFAPDYNKPPQTETVAVTDYDLLAQEVDAAQMRIPAREDLPEGELDFSVTRGGGLFGSKAEGYQIATREDDPKYYVKCSPVAGRRLTPNGEIGGTEVKRETSLNEDTGFCLHAVDFIYGEHLYWVRCESRQGPVEEAPEVLEAIAASILFDQ